MRLYAVIRKCCTSGLCIGCHDAHKQGRGPLPLAFDKRDVVCQYLTKDEEQAMKVRDNWREYGSGVFVITKDTYGTLVNEVLCPDSADWVKECLRRGYIHPDYSKAPINLEDLDEE